MWLLQNEFMVGIPKLNYVKALEEKPSSITVFVLPGGTKTAGLNIAGARKIYVSKDYLENPLEGALVLFGEYQHITSENGTLDEDEAQIEFYQVRDKIPGHLRTKKINELIHGQW
ncbi:MAG: hypothetical protein LBL62_02790 [Planctomycetaceae bacterium]|jgi:hypothetical protein|nr:hypothetical protein [Planctomycetaceae bacterium]